MPDNKLILSIIATNEDGGKNALVLAAARATGVVEKMDGRLVKLADVHMTWDSWDLWPVVQACKRTGGDTNTSVLAITGLSPEQAEQLCRLEFTLPHTRHNGQALFPRREAQIHVCLGNVVNTGIDAKVYLREITQEGLEKVVDVLKS